MTLEFGVIFPAPFVVFGAIMGLVLLFMIYWVTKWIVSIYTGAGGG